jgi:Ni2+-binding GTPase involved in maturation of urease and hydrogenase
VIEAAPRTAGDRASTSLDSLMSGLAGAIETRRDDQPFFIELAGTPRSGKTTVLTTLARMLRERDLRVETVDESANGCPIPDKCHPAFNVWTFCTTLTKVLAAQHTGTDVVLIDRGILDAACWMEWYRFTGCLTIEEHCAIETFVLHPLWARAMNLVVVMKADPAVAVGRDGAEDAGRRPGPIVNPDTLGQFNASVDRVHDRFNRHYPLVPLDTTRMRPAEVLHRLVHAALARC